MALSVESGFALYVSFIITFPFFKFIILNLLSIPSNEFIPSIIFSIFIPVWIAKDAAHKELYILLIPGALSETGYLFFLYIILNSE